MKLILTAAVKRTPLSLAPYFYHMEPGDAVYLVREITATCFMVSDVENPSERISEDIFTVTASEVRQAETAAA